MNYSKEQLDTLHANAITGVKRTVAGRDGREVEDLGWFIDYNEELHLCSRWQEAGDTGKPAIQWTFLP